MMYLTLETLSAFKDSPEELTNDWESQIDKNNIPKKKFPLVMKDNLKELELDFGSPELKSPKNSKRIVKTTTIVETGKKKDKNKKLF